MRLAMTRMWIAMGSALLVALIGPTWSASAASVWQAGVRLSGAPNWASWDGPNPATDYMVGAKCEIDAGVIVNRTGDYVYVKDTCTDGRSAVGRVTWSAAQVRTCRNSHGKGTWVRCNFDWPENTGKVLRAGVYNGNTGYLRFDNYGQVAFNK